MYTALTNGDNRDRTDDLMIANHTLYQLSYIPKTDYCNIPYCLILVKF